MPRHKLTKKDRSILNLLGEGVSRTETARRLNIPVSTVHNKAKILVNMGLLRWIPGTHNPAIYEFAEHPESEQCENEARSEKVVNPTGSVKTPTPLGTKVVIADKQLNDANPDLPGVYYGDEPPESYGRAHISGGIYYEVRSVGEFGDVVDGYGLHIGYWEKTKPICGGQSTAGAIRIHGGHYTFRFQLGSKGGRSFSFHPAGVWVDPRYFPDAAAVKTLIMNDALYTANVLKKTGWDLASPELKGTMHIAWPNHPLIQHMDEGVHEEGSDLVVDSSPGFPELEIEHLNRAEDWAKAQLMADLPSRFLALEAREGEDRGSILSISAELRAAILQHTRDLEAMGVDMVRIVALLEQMRQAHHLTTDILGQQTEQSALLIQINGNILKLQSDDAQRRLDQFSTPQAYAAEDQDRDSAQQKPKHLEGYQ